MSAFLIDPENSSISKLAIERGNYDAIRDAIGCHFLAIAANLSNNDTVFINENTLLNPGPKYAIYVDGELHTLQGRAVVIGSDHVGECSKAKTSNASLISMVIWPEQAKTQAYG